MLYKLVIFIIITLGFSFFLVYLFNKPDNIKRDQKNATVPIASSTPVTGFIPYWDQDEGIKSFRENTDKFDSVAFFWYKLNPDGSIGVYNGAIVDHRIIEYAHDRNVKVFALIANLTDEGQEGEEWDNARIWKVIGTASARQKHIKELVDLIVYNNFDGLALDYESLSLSQRENYSRFVEELASALHTKKKQLDIAIHPKTSEDKNIQFEGALAQDYSRLAALADKLHFMFYTQNGKHSMPAPPATVVWTNEALDYAINQLNIPREKIVLGIGLFGVSWQTNNRGRLIRQYSDLKFSQITEIIKKENPPVFRDEETKSLQLIRNGGNTTQIIWFNDEKSVERMVDIARGRKLGGISFWRLGGEDKKIWE